MNGVTEMKEHLKKLLHLLGYCAVYLVLGFIILITVVMPLYVMLFWPGPG